MYLHFFDDIGKFVKYVLLWIGFAAVQTLSLSILLPIPFYILIVDSAFHSFIYGSVGLLLWSALKYGKFESLPFFQRIINYSALVVLTIVTTVALGYGFETFFGKFSDRFIPFLPLRSLITFLIYMLLIYYYRMNTLSSVSKNEYVVESESNVNNEQRSVNDTDNEIIERVALKLGQKIHVIPVDEILYLQAEGDYVKIHTMNGKFLKEQTMKYFEEHLPNSQFVRVHRSYILNIESISRIDLYEKQTQQVTLKNGHQIKLSQGGYKLLRSKLNL